MALEDHLTSTPGAAQPTGARFEQDGSQLVVTTGARTVEPTRDEWDELLDEWGYDIGDWVVDHSASIRVSGYEQLWKDSDGQGHVQKLRAWQLHLRRREPADGDPFDVEALRKQIKGRKPRKAAPVNTGAAFVVALSDWQIGKGEQGGTAATVDRIQTSFAAKVDRIRKAKPSTVYLAGLGDLAENCVGFYPDQPNRIDLNRREQMQVATSLVLDCIDQVVHVPRVVVSSVPSNHGENRQAKGVTATDALRDNLDLELLDRVAQVIAANPDRYGHVELVQPSDRFPEVCTVELDGAWLATHHGHFRGSGRKAVAAGTRRMDTALNWLANNFLNGRGAAGADMLLFGHGHHLILAEESQVPALQVPAMDGGSEWFSASSGVSSPPGMVSFMFGETVRAVTGGRVYTDLDID